MTKRMAVGLAAFAVALITFAGPAGAAHRDTEGDDKACTKGPIDQSICDSYDD